MRWWIGSLNFFATSKSWSNRLRSSFSTSFSAIMSPLSKEKAACSATFDAFFDYFGKIHDYFRSVIVFQFIKSLLGHVFVTEHFIVFMLAPGKTVRYNPSFGTCLRQFRHATVTSHHCATPSANFITINCASCMYTSASE